MNQPLLKKFRETFLTFTHTIMYCYAFHIGKNLLGVFLIQNGVKQGHAIAFQLCFRICYQEGPRNSEITGTEWKTSAPGLC